MNGCRRSLLKTLLENEKLLVMSNWFFPHSVFYPFGELTAIFLSHSKLSSANSFSLEMSKVVWERVDNQYSIGMV